jgi:hypothetical protein
LKLTKAWQLSRYPYNEVAYRSIEMSRGSNSSSLPQGQDAMKRYERTIGSAKISKVAFAVFGTIGAAFPFAEYIISPTPEALVSGISLSMAISLAYIVFFSLQILPSFSSGEAYFVLRTLPISERDFSLVSMLSFLRAFDYIAITTSVVQIGAVALLTRSLLATVMMAIGAGVNVVFAAGLALWFSGIFYKNVTRGGRSRKATVGRALFLVTWGVAAMSIGFLFNFISYILPYFSGAILGTITQPAGLVISAIHPFSTSLVITNIVYPLLYESALPSRVVLLVPRYVPPILSYVATFSYFGVALLVAKRTLRSVTDITHGAEIVRATRQIVEDYSLKLRRPLSAYIVKDLKLAAKNPSMAFFYASPLFEVVILALVTAQFPVMRVEAMFVATIIGCFFAIMFCSTLLNTEGAALEYTLSLPIRGRVIIDAKALMASLAYMPAPFALLAIGLSKHVTSGSNLLIPFVEILAVVAACIAEIGFFVKPRRGVGAEGAQNSGAPTGQTEGFSIMAGSDVKRLMQALAISWIILLVPVAAYTVSFILTANHLLAIGTMAALAIMELGVVLTIVRRVVH